MRLKSDWLSNCLLQRKYFFNFLNKMASTYCRQLDVSSSNVKALLTTDVKYLCGLFTSKGHEIRLVGGAVRDMLTGKNPKDFDLSTTASPPEMIEIFKDNSIRYIETGLQHGTLTVHLNNCDYEVTTLRIDVETYGRQAKVQFTNDWKLDAERRDLTVNALSLDVDGVLWDYFNGEADLKAGKVRFVGDTEKRIREDYLRILRYFRFYGKIAPNISSHDPDTLAAIEKLSVGLKNIAVERIWLEINRILTGRFASHLIKLLYEKCVAQNIGLPECTEHEFNELESVSRHCEGLNPDPITILVSLVRTAKDAENICLRWKLANNEKNLAVFIATYRHVNKKASVKFYKDIIVKTTPGSINVIREYVIELLKYEGFTSIIDELSDWVVPRFPVTGGDLKNLGVAPGKEMGRLLNRLKELWVDSYYEYSKDDLLEKFKNEKI